MPLSAVVNGTLVVSLDFDRTAWSTLSDSARAGTSTVLMRCGVPGVTVTPPLRTPFFRHAPGQLDVCGVQHKPETPAHREAKAAIIVGCQQAKQPGLEETGVGTDWIADVLASQSRVAFEVQTSGQTEATYRHRQNQRAADGYTGIWFISNQAQAAALSPTMPAFPLSFLDGVPFTVLEGQQVPLEDAVVALLLNQSLWQPSHPSGTPPVVAPVLLPTGPSGTAQPLERPAATYQRPQAHRVVLVKASRPCWSCGQKSLLWCDSTEHDRPARKPTPDSTVEHRLSNESARTGLVLVSQTWHEGAAGWHPRWACPHCCAVLSEPELSVWDPPDPCAAIRPVLTEKAYRLP